MNIWVWILSIWICFPAVAEEAETLSVATFNVGMLEASHSVPFLKQRQNVLAREVRAFLEESSPDVLAIQEAWTKESAQSLVNVHPSYLLLNLNQRPWIPFLDNNTGLLFLIKKSLKSNSQFIPFKSFASYVCGWGVFCSRGLLKVSFFKGKKKINIFNTHLTPMYFLVKNRLRQLEEISEIFKSKTEFQNEISILVGDMNFSKEFGTLIDDSEGTNADWSKNAELYAKFKELTNIRNIVCEDTFHSAKGTYRFTQDRETNLTAKSCPSSGKAPSQRNDMIIACGQGKRSWQSINQSLIFESPIKSEDRKFHLSDHFGIVSTIRL